MAAAAAILEAYRCEGDPIMEKFEKLAGVAAPMPLVNIDTDMIIPKVFLKTIKRSGLGVNLFDEMRYDREGNEKPDFVLNKTQYREAKILVAVIILDVVLRENMHPGRLQILG